MAEPNGINWFGKAPQRVMNQSASIHVPRSPQGSGSSQTLALAKSTASISTYQTCLKKCDTWHSRDSFAGIHQPASGGWSRSRCPWYGNLIVSDGCSWHGASPLNCAMHKVSHYVQCTSAPEFFSGSFCQATPQFMAGNQSSM